MARRLDVYWGATLVGSLEQTDTGKLRFRYASTWLEGANNPSLSQSLPLQSEVFNERAARPFFAGLLPEADMRNLVAKGLGVSRRNDFALLNGIGGECAGAIRFLHAGEKPREPRSADYRTLDDAALSQIFDELSDRPLLAGEDGVRLSLAGAQEKIPVFISGKRLALPLHGAASSHILKPSISRFAGIATNEDFCLRLARAAGLHVVNAELRKAKARQYLLVERYDRAHDTTGALQRIHQEDFCQALAIPPELKYQAEGGPTLKSCFALVRRASARPVIDLARLLDAVIFNALIGNNDAHGKNFSLLYAADGTALAPLYDLVSTVAYPKLSLNLAMKIGGASRFDELTPRAWNQFARDAALGPAQVRQRLISLARLLPRVAREMRSEGAGAAGSFAPIIDQIIATLEHRAGSTLETASS